VRFHTERLYEQLQPGCQGERLVGLLSAEGNEIGRVGVPGNDVAVCDLAHRHVGDQRVSVGGRNADSERRRPNEGFGAVRMRQPRRRGGGQRSREGTVSQPPDPVAEHSRRERVRRDDHTGVLGRLRQQRVADRSEREVAKRATAVPPLEAWADVNALRPGRRIEVVERRQPVDACEAVSELPPSLGVEEVVREQGCVGLDEPEATNALNGLAPLSRRGEAPS
jgi:hypothetical protein